VTAVPRDLAEPTLIDSDPTPTRTVPATEATRALDVAGSFRGLWSRSEVRLALFVFVVVAAATHPAVGLTSNGNVEQWTNLTNESLTGPQDFLFSYGPLFWLTGGAAAAYSVATLAATVAFTAATQSAFWTLFYVAVSRKTAYALGALAAAIVVAAEGLLPSVAFFAWPLLLILPLATRMPTRRRTRYALMVALGSYVGFVLYVRVFFGVVAGIAFLGVLVVHALSGRWRDLAIAAASTVIAYAVVGLVVYRDAASLVRYAVVNLALSSGNGVDMTLEVANYPWVWLAAAAVVLCCVLLPVPTWSAAIPVALVAFVLVKLGFGRADHVQGYFVVPGAVLILAARPWRLSRAKAWAAVTASAAILALAVVPSFPGGPVLAVVQDVRSTAQPYAERMKALYPRFVLDQATLALIGGGTVDVYPYNNEFAFANGLAYHHRPVFQSYMTLTPQLGRMNADYLQSDAGPEFILWTGGLLCGSPTCDLFATFDSKYPLNEDPLTALAILGNYHVVRSTVSTGGIPVLVLRRNETIAPVQPKTLSRVAARTGEWIDVPVSSDVVLLKPQLHLTPVGQAKNALLRGSALHVSYRLADGTERTYRLNLLNAPAGIWVSPLLEGTSFSGVAVTAVRIDAPDWYVTPQYEAEWQSVALASVSAPAPTPAAG
jgi:hypothetical protein